MFYFYMKKSGAEIYDLLKVMVFMTQGCMAVFGMKSPGTEIFFLR